MAKKKIGFVGTGKMGANMARRLKDRGYQISAIYDVRKDIAQALGEELNSISCEKLAQVTAASDVVITVVTDDTSMRKIYMGKKDSLLTDAVGKIFINCATVSPQTHIDVEKAAKKAKAASLEGCMASVSYTHLTLPTILRV